ncbi:PAS domain S-box-containing protein [Clostridium saccharoperbutylacetonicum]|uniref:histidine kinase n=1 Tax=Clostridium saccharoperbutylacetonicum N1-4(HMT) TaxID=931276 RepID=M1MXS8_9CLOT|nr:PAS domain-containing hybrid sensor histidine kinase/response regulator [Clostridium saccharoperbutylacetonicum]AGF56222.1 PAS domain S-box [Clostridium saccharoperbutylacetonicum N1-4(HMT)]NRT63035.1 PAS domain S-box-containing protein [Clostridium saccharoperbutylacetonicum]NSB26392.1 PAS domain S-box-containing protein [Clostridium saccharoperbutylacetonicum]NSB45745.1 PAS domain S-box-containing protein [Clostridium saccharoperbutylacetonicum]
MDLKSELWIDELQRIGKVGIFSYDRRKGIINVSDVVYELLGISDKCVRDKKGWLNVIHPKQREEIREYFRVIIETRQDFDKEFKILCESDNVERWIEFKGKVFCDKNGMAEKISGTIHDVSEIKKNEEKFKKLYMEFQEKESLLVSLINSIPDLIYFKDIYGSYLGCNKSFEKFSGLKREEILGNKDVDIFSEEVAKTFLCTDEKTVYSRKTYEFEEWVEYATGEKILLNTLKTPYYNPKGDILGIIGVSRNITEKSKREQLKKDMENEKLRLDELKEIDRMKTEFFANISHELRTPINVIYSALQMEQVMLKNLFGENDQQDKMRYVKMMKQNCYRLLRLIENLIDITKFENGYVNINKSNYDIVSLVENVVLSVAGYIENRDLSIIFDTDIEEKVIALDAEKMERIILNLLSNAVKFTPSGGNITVKVHENNNYIFIQIKDTGKGIPEDKLNSIFERFVQVDKPSTRNHEGSGIGLSIVKSLVEQHGGDISVESKEGIGTEFVIKIPCEVIQGESCKFNLDELQMNKGSISRVNIEFSNL